MSILKIISEHSWRSLWGHGGTRWFVALFNLLTLTALLTSYRSMELRQDAVQTYSREVRARWVNSPDKHPHRMAHYGYIAFRASYPLSFFDGGMDNYAGNAVFLEAHRQNSTNFSEASLSNGLLRFGELSAGMMLQLLLPLLIFFWGFDLIAKERENGTLKILLTQGVRWSELILGKTLGLWALSMTILAPAVLAALALLMLHPSLSEHPAALVRFALLTSAYVAYLFVVSLLTVGVSAKSGSSKSALTTLIGCWLFFTLVAPKVAQAAGQALYPSPSKIEFETAVERELIQQGDSHNPDDPHYKALRDSVLQVFQVDSIHKLPFNYSGFVMREGERLSAETYNRHYEKLMRRYENQQQAVRYTALVNPYLAIKHLSMALAGSDFASYRHFQAQAEAFRYQLAQTMNELQIKLISNRKPKPTEHNHIIDRKHWAEFPDFHHSFLGFGHFFRYEWLSALSLALWLAGLIFWINKATYKV